MKKSLKILIVLVTFLIIFILTYIFPLSMVLKISETSTPLTTFSINTMFYYYTGILILFFWIISFMLKKKGLKIIGNMFIANSILLALGILYFTVFIY